MMHSEKRITKALIRLHGCAGWSAPVLFANPKDRFSRFEAQIVYVFKFSHYKSMEAIDPWGVVNLDFRGLIGRIYVGDH